MALHILYEDNHLLVVNKPAGLLVQGDHTGDETLLDQARAYLKEKYQKPGNVFIGLVHRLDRDTSGCLMISKRRSELRALHELLREGQIEKRYLALLTGRLKEDRVVCEAPLSIRRRGGERYVEVDAEGRNAHTEFYKLQEYRSATLVEVLLGTGRTHQIRVHAAHLGVPVAGDDRYGDRSANKQFAAHGLRRLFLHAHSLRFTRPSDGEDFHVSAPLNDELRSFLDQLP